MEYLFDPLFGIAEEKQEPRAQFTNLFNATLEQTADGGINLHLSPKAAKQTRGPLYCIEQLGCGRLLDYRKTPNARLELPVVHNGILKPYVYLLQDLNNAYLTMAQKKGYGPELVRQSMSCAMTYQAQDILKTTEGQTPPAA